MVVYCATKERIRGQTMPLRCIKCNVGLRIWIRLQLCYSNAPSSPHPSYIYHLLQSPTSSHHLSLITISSRHTIYHSSPSPIPSHHLPLITISHPVTPFITHHPLSSHHTIYHSSPSHPVINTHHLTLKGKSTSNLFISATLQLINGNYLSHSSSFVRNEANRLK